MIPLYEMSKRVNPQRQEVDQQLLGFGEEKNKE